MERLIRHGPAAFSVILYLLLAALLCAAVLGAAGGRLIYVLDDAYIHMAVAKNLAAHGTWGIHPGEFASVSSSPLWTLLLAGVVRLTGPLEIVPFALNLLFGVLALLLFHRLLVDAGMPPPARLLLAIAFVLATPLPAMAFTGQEHTLHILLTLAFFFVAMRGLDDPSPALSRCGAAVLGLAAAALTACRYEGAFLALAAGLLFAARRDWRRLLVTGAGSAFPIALYGTISLSKGWAFLPNSLLLKGIHLDFSTGSRLAASLGGTALTQLARNDHLLMPVLAGLIFLLLGPSARGRAAALLFLLSTLLHLQFARTGWFFRYEAWLVALALAAFAAAAGGRRWTLPDPRPLRLAALAGLAVVAGAPFALRAYGALVQVPGAARNIFEQQVQVGEMLRRSFPGTAVAVNDIGAVAYYADVRVLDLWGLATMEAARHKLDGTYTTAVIDALARERGVTVAAVYDGWFDAYGGFPPAWERVGTWTIRDNIVCGKDTVAFYAAVPGAKEALERALLAYAPHLPPSVVQRGAYLERQGAGENP